MPQKKKENYNTKPKIGSRNVNNIYNQTRTNFPQNRVKTVKVKNVPSNCTFRKMTVLICVILVEAVEDLFKDNR